MNQPLIDFLSQGGTLVTANLRLARNLQQQYGDLQLSNQKHVWNKPNIFTIEPFLSQLANQFNFKELLINHTEAEFLSREMLRSSTFSDKAAFDLQTLAKLIKQAFDLIDQWEIPINPALFANNPDSEQFFNWLIAFKDSMQQKQLTPLGEFCQKIAKHIAPNQYLAHYGFDSLPTCITRLFPTNSEYLFTQGIFIQNNISCKRVAFASFKEELEAMVGFAYDLQLQEPTAKIGCVVPSLMQDYETILTAFSKVFSKDTFLNYSQLHQGFNISGAHAFHLNPIIHISLILLQLKQGVIAFEELLFLITSPFLTGSMQEENKRAFLRHQLSEKNISVINLKGILELIPTEITLLKTLFEQLQNLPITDAKQYPSQWIPNLLSILQIMGWPGERRLNSTEYQLAQRMQTLVEELNHYDHVMGLLSFSQVIHELRYLASSLSFQPESPSANVHVLGLLEASGLDFDYLWIMGLNDTVFPALPKPNPFIPTPLQIEFNLPHSSAQRELHFAKQILERLIRQSSKVILSYPLQEDEQILRPSPLILNYPLENIHVSEINKKSLAEILRSHQCLETLSDEYGPPLSNDVTELSGGTAILKQQAACPFRSFAIFRLQAEKALPSSLGISKIERGSLIHAVLEKFWQQIKNQNQLLSLSDKEIEDLLEKLILLSLQEQGKNISERLQELEKIVLLKFLKRWLAFEKKRETFEVIATEIPLKINIENINLTMKADRIDEVFDGYIIIDYKTGKPNIQDCFGDRPEEPQLPLYCLAYENQAKAIAFGLIHQDATSLKGVGSLNNEMLGIKTLANLYPEKSWQSQKNEWQQTMNQLMQSFKSGNARVEPKDPNITCEHCHLKTLCRIHENE